MAGGAEGGISRRYIRRGSQIGDNPRQQRFERIGNEVEVLAALHRLVIVRRSAQWERAAHRQGPHIAQ